LAPALNFNRWREKRLASDLSSAADIANRVLAMGLRLFSIAQG
jgi:hypothetical protein